MTRGNIKIKNPERFMGEHEISSEKLDAAIKKATDKLRSKIEIYKDYFPQNSYRSGAHNVYLLGENNNWQSGLLTGCMVLAYDLTGEKCFLDTAIAHLPTYLKRLDNSFDYNYDLHCHDVGFVFTPSCVALYKRTGNEEAKALAIRAARHLYNVSYSHRGGFFVSSVLKAAGPLGCRTMMDTLMNVPLLFWAAEELDLPHLKDAAHSQNKITRDFLIREDGSSYHHYKFDIDTHKPVGGLTFQGNRDESTWSRGHSWGVYGFPVAYGYTGDESLLKVHNDVVAFMLNHLPDDNIPYWDYDFVEGDEPRDTPAAVISACGLLEAIKYLPSNAPERKIYFNAANMMIEAVIDRYTGDFAHNDQLYDGLIFGCTGSRPHGIDIEGCALYGDFFYLEALLRLKNPEWKSPW